MHEQFDHRSADRAASEIRSPGPQLTTPQPATHDLPGIAQVFGAVFTVLLAAVVGATLSGLVAAVLTAAAAGCVCATIYVATNRRPWSQGKKMLLGGLVASSFVLIGTAVVVAVSGNQSPTSGTAASGSDASSAPWLPQTAAPRSAPSTSEPQHPEPIVAKTNYRLIPSSNPLTNDADKVDLDTGCPGWGPTSIPVGRDRCGEAADLILEPTDLHTYEELPRLVSAVGVGPVNSRIHSSPALSESSRCVALGANWLRLAKSTTWREEVCVSPGS